MKSKTILLKCFLFVAIMGATTYSYGQEQATIKVNLAQEKGPMTPIWAWFGYDEPNYTYMKDGKKLLSEIAAIG